MKPTEYRLKTYINQDLKVFSNLDNVRSIPSIIDGLKDSQRKAVYGLFKHGTGEIKVAQLGSYAAMITNYLHGEGSMCDTIVGLAQRFPGANNINLFEPVGQFGSILSPGASAPRYIYTKPSPHLRKMFRREDDLILNPKIEEGECLEPESYYPVLPLWLVNGSVGIGTGHSVKIMPRSPKLVADLIGKLVTGTAVRQDTIDKAMTPYFEGWKGKVVKGASDSQWELHGIIEQVNTTTLRVTELPVSYDVDKFKSILIDLMDKGVVKNYDNNSTEEGFDFEISVPREVGKKNIEELKSIFKIVSKVGENVTLWNSNGVLERFENVYDALLHFIEFRKGMYEVRKGAQLEQMKDELGWLRAKIKFLMYWNTQMKDPHKKPKSELRAELTKVVDDQYLDRLLSLQISSLTMESVKEAEDSVTKVLTSVAELEKKTADDLYRDDLKDL